MKRRKRQTTYWGKKFENHIFDNGLISEYIKSPKSSIRKQIKSEKKIWTDPKKKKKEKKRDWICGYQKWVVEGGGTGWKQSKVLQTESYKINK